MKTLLIMLVLVGRSGYEPQYAVEYPDQASCLKAQAEDKSGRFGPTIGSTKTVCVPKLLYKQEAK